MTMHRFIAAPLMVLHALLVVGSIHLHSGAHAHDHGLSMADLPDYLHHHDYRFGERTGGEPVLEDVCIGCRLERTPALAAATTPGVVAAGATQETRLRDGFTTLRDHRPTLPRAPPTV